MENMQKRSYEIPDFDIVLSSLMLWLCPTFIFFVYAPLNYRVVLLILWQLMHLQATPGWSHIRHNRWSCRYQPPFQRNLFYISQAITCDHQVVLMLLMVLRSMLLQAMPRCSKHILYNRGSYRYQRPSRRNQFRISQAITHGRPRLSGVSTGEMDQ